MRRKNTTRQYLYPVVIEPLDEGGFLAVCPTLPGCHAEGDTREEALEIIQDVMRIFIEDARASGEELPPSLHEKAVVTVVQCAA